MARATVEATAKDKGITQGSLESKIDHLAASGHISEAMKEAAHEIRLAGNQVAHSDILNEPISVEDAAEIVELMDAILERAYQEPAKVARVRASREARQNGQVTA
jgi:transcriptional regulator